MDLEQLKQLDVIAQQRTLSSSSKMLHMSQSALSRSMQRLELDLGQELFTRSKNKAELNDAGRIALEHARAILREERAMRDSLARYSQQMRMLLVATVAPAPVWRLTSLIVERFPGTVLSPMTLSPEGVEERLFEHSVDMAISISPVEAQGFRSIEFMNECLRVLLPPAHPLSGAEFASLADFDGEQFLVDASAGFWIDMVRRHMPRARLIEQSDRKVLHDLVRSSGLPTFSTNVTEEWVRPEDHTCVKLSDNDAHVTFYLTVPEDASDIVNNVANYVAGTAPKRS